LRPHTLVGMGGNRRPYGPKGFTTALLKFASFASSEAYANSIYHKHASWVDPTHNFAEKARPNAITYCIVIPPGIANAFNEDTVVRLVLP